MIHVGDITNLNGGTIEPVDVITFGSPCQDLSTAGHRAGLSGERSSLFLDAIRVIKEMRRATNGRYPRYAIWENVPGAFSSHGGQDFREVLEQLAQIKAPNAVIPRSPRNKWPTAGCILGTGWSLAWRVFNAQFWGVPQSRRRIALIADFAGRSPTEILFEPGSLPSSSFPSGSEREAFPSPHRTCTEKNAEALTVQVHYSANSGRSPLVKFDRSATLTTTQTQILMQPTRDGFLPRRLTPLECERLQGFPDMWTVIAPYKINNRTVLSSDCARYKALGNSIALPPWRWVLRRVSDYLPSDATLGSLFDGIGGFPLLWEENHPAGSARWASEIERFPIAVTNQKINHSRLPS